MDLMYEYIAFLIVLAIGIICFTIYEVLDRYFEYKSNAKLYGDDDDEKGE